MSVQNQAIDYGKALENSYERWEHIYKHGCYDPFFEDGVNLNLVRNHIIHYKEMLEKESSLFAMPDAYYREIPPKVDSKYIARSDEIRANAIMSMQRIDEDNNLKYVREHSCDLTEKQRSQLCVPAVIGYADTLRKAIADGDVLTMRRYERCDHYLEAFRSLAEKMGSADAIIHTESNTNAETKISNTNSVATETEEESIEEYEQLMLF